jgi:hypothetical protein
VKWHLEGAGLIFSVIPRRVRFTKFCRVEAVEGGGGKNKPVMWQLSSNMIREIDQFVHRPSCALHEAPMYFKGQTQFG